MITLIAAVDRNWAIGKNNGLLYHLPEDMKHFRETTTGCCVIYGRKTLESFPGGRPLKNRLNIVLSRSYTSIYDNLLVASSPEEAIRLAEQQDQPIYICGGSSVYAAFLPYCDCAILTKIDASCPDADAFFPNLDADEKWNITATSDKFRSESGLTYQFFTYNRII